MFRESFECLSKTVGLDMCLDETADRIQTGDWIVDAASGEMFAWYPTTVPPDLIDSNAPLGFNRLWVLYSAGVWMRQLLGLGMVFGLRHCLH